MLMYSRLEPMPIGEGVRSAMLEARLLFLGFRWYFSGGMPGFIGGIARRISSGTRTDATRQHGMLGTERETKTLTRSRTRVMPAGDFPLPNTPQVFTTVDEGWRVPDHAVGPSWPIFQPAHEREEKPSQTKEE